MINNKYAKYFLCILIILTSTSLVNAASNDKKGDFDNSLRKVTTIDQIDSSNFTNTAILQSLNKITAKTKRLELVVGKEIEFGKIDIAVHKCWKSPSYMKPENKILLEIFQRNNDNKRERIFYGWMLSSSPSISSLEHPIYDITALECTSVYSRNKKK